MGARRWASYQEGEHEQHGRADPERGPAMLD
jgi:hypothetical protein